MSAPACILGVDPGLGGAVAFYFPAQGVVSVDDMPVVARYGAEHIVSVGGGQ